MFKKRLYLLCNWVINFYTIPLYIFLITILMGFFIEDIYIELVINKISVIMQLIGLIMIVKPENISSLIKEDFVNIKNKYFSDVSNKKVVYSKAGSFRTLAKNKSDNQEIVELLRDINKKLDRKASHEDFIETKSQITNLQEKFNKYIDIEIKWSIYIIFGLMISLFSI